MLKEKIISAAIWAVGATLTFILFLVMLALTIVTFPFDRKRKIVHAQCFWWSDAVIALNPYWNLTVSGLENIDKDKTYVIVANHQSLADIAMIYQIRAQFKWVAKESLFSIPVLGWCMYLARHIKLARGKFSSIKKVYREAAEWLRSGVSVLFFPEGTRSTTNDIKDFQNGAFKLAIKERLPILPVTIFGAGDAMPKGKWVFTTSVPVKLKVLPPIYTDGFGPADFERLRDMTRRAMERA